jgi:hypothetical protein
MKPSLDLWVDLLAASLARLLAPTLAVVVHEALRSMPLIESNCATAFVNLSALKYADFRPVPGGLPTRRERIDATERPAEALSAMQRAGLVVMGVPTDPVAASRWPQLQAQDRWWILYGESRAPGWAQAAALMRSGEFIPFELGSQRVMISRQAVDALGGRHAVHPSAAPKLAGALARAQPQRLAIEAGQGYQRLRLNIDPILLIAAGTDMLTHNLLQEGRAILSARGLGAVLLPWDDKTQVQLLFRNVRARIDDMVLAAGDKVLALSRIDYTEYGALLNVVRPEVHPGRDALLHIALPRVAVPGDGFCDVGAANVTVELA